jgi:hypothetical protein
MPGRKRDRCIEGARRSAVDHPRERFRTGWKPAAHAVPLGGPLSYSFTRDHPEPAGSVRGLRGIPLSVDSSRVARTVSILDHALLQDERLPLALCATLPRSSVDRSSDAGIPYSSPLRATSSASGRDDSRNSRGSLAAKSIPPWVRYRPRIAECFTAGRVSSPRWRFR